MAPTVAVEILSPGDRREDLDDKIVTYLAAGCLAVIVVEPKAETVVVYDREGRKPQPGPHLRHAALPDLELDIRTIFESARR
jgi:Uma2 family endonuclease